MVPGIADDDAPSPRTMQEVEGLINTLYNTSTTPADVHRINRTLQKLQRSPDGWLLATSLSNSSNEHVQFFAASTWMVKLNTDWQGLSEPDALSLLDSLITWLIRVVEVGFKPFIWRKICVTLVNYYIRFYNLWQHCVRHLVCRFAGVVTGVQQDGLHTLPPTETLLARLSNVSKTVIVGFTRTLIEEVGKIDSKNSKGLHYYEGMNLNTPDAASATMALLTEPGSPLNQLTVEQVTLVEEALKCYQSWATYSTREAGQALQLFQPITRVTFEWLESPQIYRVASETVTEMLTNGFYFYTAEDNHFLAERISGTWGQGKFSHVVPKEHDDYDSEETDAFAHMLVAFAESNLKALVLTVDSHTSQTIFEMLHGLLRLPGFPIADEEVSNLEFEFWSSLTEFMTDQPFEEGAPKPHWWDQCRSHLLRAVQEYWVKIRIPPPDVLTEWFKDDKDGFQSYRKDFADLVETAYPVLQSELFGELVQHALNQVNTPHPDWQEVESCLFCINALADSLTTEPKEYNYLSALFQSPLFSILANPESQELSRTKLSAISVIGSYSEYFEKHTELLPGALNFLFSSLTIPKLINQASKSILSLCSSCRTKLVSELPAFIQHYQIFASRRPSECLGRERVLGALGCLIQALDREEDKASALEPLLTSVSADFIACKQLLSAGYGDEARDRALLALKSLVSLGKSLQAPEDGPIIIDESNGSQKPRTIWDDGPGHQLQILLAQAVEDIAATFPKDWEITKEACDVFRCGFTESLPGLLVFPPRLVVDFLLSCGSRSPFHDVTIGTASAFVNCISLEGYDECRRLTGYVFGLIQRLDGTFTLYISLGRR
ncbi:Importin-13 [Dactylellina cionopaga]|nr:Importin-13 [Dactylellina cionopaga]